MALPKPENTEIDHATEDSGVHIRDTHSAPATHWQIFIAALLVITILVIFFYGLTEQRTYIAGVPPANSNIASPLGHDQQQAISPKVAPTPATTGAAIR